MAEAKLDITDELLVAYVDDELDATQRAMVTSVLAENPSLSRRAQEMRLARDLLREAFPLQPEESLPPPIEIAANRLAEASARQRSPPRLKSPFKDWWIKHRRSYSIAAGLALCLAAAASYLIWRSGSEPAGEAVTALMRIDPHTGLYGVLESTPSAEVFNVPAEQAAVRALLTFRARDGRYCREFEILAASGGSTGVACRARGAWHAEVLMSARAAAPNSDYYTPAGESDDVAVSAVVDRLIQGDPLSAQEESRLLASGWKVSGSP